MELLAVRPAVDLSAPLNTTKLAPVSLRSLLQMLIAWDAVQYMSLLYSSSAWVW